MLAYILSFMIGSGSFALYMAAFFFPEVHRKNDFAWSGVGLFYALVLWVCAERITGGLLLGQIASVALLGWLAGQTLILRRQVAPQDQQTPLPTADEVKASLAGLTSAEGRAGVAGQASHVFNQVKQGMQGAVAGVTFLKRSPTQTETYVPPSPEEFGTAGQAAIARFAKAAIPDSEPVALPLSQVEDTIRETIPRETADTAEQAKQEMLEKLADLTETSTETLANTGADSTQTVKHAIAPVPKQMTETSADPVKGFGGMFQGLNPKNQKKESKPVYVRKQFREEAAAPAKTEKKPSPKENQKKESKPVYVRKQFREEVASEPKELIKDAIAEVKDATNSLAEMPAAIAATSETISEAVVSDLLGNAPVETSAAEIVEDLLEDISAQEGTLVLKATEIIEVAIELGDATIEPITWVAELENDTATETFTPKHATDSEHSDKL